MPSAAHAISDQSTNNAEIEQIKQHAEADSNGFRDRFAHFSHTTARLSGRPVTFILALGMVIAWALTGPLFDYSDTWQLIINTSTTVVTFLMVFLIQNTQNRDTLALQVKLAELITVMKGASNDIAVAEDLSEDELERLHKFYSTKAEHALKSLEAYRAQRKD